MSDHLSHRPSLGVFLRILIAGLVSWLLLPDIMAQKNDLGSKLRQKPDYSKGFVFSLLPRSLQKNPILDLNVNTELTALGRKVTPPSSSQPTYYIAQPAGYRQLGLDLTGEDALAGPALVKIMKQSLESAGYLESTVDHPPTLALVYHWGSHYTFMTTFEREVLDEYPLQLIASTLIERANLVGGSRFARDFADALVHSSQDEILSFAQGDGVPPLSPLSVFVANHPHGEYLAETIAGSVYYVVVSAFDGVALAQGQRRLLWRTRMTISTDGVSMEETLPPLILNASPYLGRATNGTEVISRRLSREGTVTIGDTQVIDYSYPKDAPPPAIKR